MGPSRPHFVRNNSELRVFGMFPSEPQILYNGATVSGLDQIRIFDTGFQHSLVLLGTQALVGAVVGALYTPRSPETSFGRRRSDAWAQTTNFVGGRGGLGALRDPTGHPGFAWRGGRFEGKLTAVPKRLRH